MKTLISILVFFLLIDFAATAQTSPGQGCDCCFIRYTYNNVGNRIKRDFYCEPLNPAGKMVQLDTNNVEEDFVLLFPNPNEGKFALQFKAVPENYDITILANEPMGTFASRSKYLGNQVAIKTSNSCKAI
jgi:hypothetical protein